MDTSLNHTCIVKNATDRPGELQLWQSCSDSKEKLNTCWNKWFICFHGKNKKKHLTPLLVSCSVSFILPDTYSIGAQPKGSKLEIIGNMIPKFNIRILHTHLRWILMSFYHHSSFGFNLNYFSWIQRYKQCHANPHFTLHYNATESRLLEALSLWHPFPYCISMHAHKFCQVTVHTETYWLAL